MGADKVCAERAGAHHEHSRGILAGKIIRRQRARCGGAPPREFGAVHHGDGSTGPVVDEKITCRDGRQAERCIVALEDDGL